MSHLETLEREQPALARLLSPLARRPISAWEPSRREPDRRTEAPAALAEAPRVRSPLGGFDRLRDAWRRRQRAQGLPGVPSNRPFCVSGLSHGLSLAADLLTAEGTPVVVPDPYWGNYRQVFSVRCGARILPAPIHDAARRFDPLAFAHALAALPAGAPAIALLNLPSNPGGYAPTASERTALLDSLVAAAERRPLVVLCDDAYAGLVFEPDVPARSPFWDLAGRHPNLVPIKIDGATKEFSLFGGRIGFLTFAIEPESPAAAALEGILRSLAGSLVGPPSAASQAALQAALDAPRIEGQIEEIRNALAGRYRALREALAVVDPELVRSFPFNAGCFALVEIPEELGVTAEEARRHLIAEEGVGLISIGERSLRIAHCSVEDSAIPELVRRLERGIATLAAGRDRSRARGV